MGALPADGFSLFVACVVFGCLGRWLLQCGQAMKFLSQHSLPRDTIERAVKQLGHDGKPFTLWNLVDALTHFNVNLRYAGDRIEADQKVAKLMELAV